MATMPLTSEKESDRTRYLWAHDTLREAVEIRNFMWVISTNHHLNSSHFSETIAVAVQEGNSSPCNIESARYAATILSGVRHHPQIFGMVSTAEGFQLAGRLLALAEDEAALSIISTFRNRDDLTEGMRAVVAIADTARSNLDTHKRQHLTAVLDLVI